MYDITVLIYIYYMYDITVLNTHIHSSIVIAMFSYANPYDVYVNQVDCETKKKQLNFLIYISAIFKVQGQSSHPPFHTADYPKVGLCKD